MQHNTFIGSVKDPVEQFFVFMLERQNIYLKKMRGDPHPLTEDSILQKYKFTNVYREQDRTTLWMRENVRNKFIGKPEVFLATVVFRWFNKIDTGDVIFNQKNDFVTPFEYFLHTGNGRDLEHNIRNRMPNGKWVTGAYIITSKTGMDKLAGICSIIEDFYHGKFPSEFEFFYDKPVNWRGLAESLLDHRGKYTLWSVWNWLSQVPFQGTFHSYENVTDLRHTALLDKAPDIYTWANAGPGAVRGLNRIFGYDLNQKMRPENSLKGMLYLLEKSKEIWPNDTDFPPLEARDIEHSLCEYDKYMRVWHNEGAPRSLYKK